MFLLFGCQKARACWHSFWDRLLSISCRKRKMCDKNSVHNSVRIRKTAATAQSVQHQTTSLFINAENAYYVRNRRTMRIWHFSVCCELSGDSCVRREFGICKLSLAPHTALKYHDSMENEECKKEPFAVDAVHTLVVIEVQANSVCLTEKSLLIIINYLLMCASSASISNGLFIKIQANFY